MPSPFVNSAYGSDSDTYVTLPAGMKVGMKKASRDGLSELTLVQAGAAIAANKECKLTGAGFTVIPAVAVTDIGFGCNDKSGVTVAINNFFWLNTRYYCSPLVNGAIAAGVTVQPSAVSGQLNTNGATDNNQVNIVTMAASGAGGATLCFRH